MHSKLGRALGPLAFLTVLAAVFAVPAAVGDDDAALEPLTPVPSAETGQMVDETSQLWFVELTSSPAADGTSPATLKAEKDAFRGAARKAGLKYSERYAFDQLWNGLSIAIDSSQIGVLSRIAGVSAIYPVVAVSLPPTAAADPELATALAMTGADVAQTELGLTGAGVRVGVIDSGIDYDHPDLGGCFGAGCRVVTGHDFVGDAFNFSDPSAPVNPVPVPDPNPDDCSGHGTHAAGIIGANGAVTGVAPGVTFDAYRVFGCNGNTSADIVLAALEQALQDKVDVVNMSLGTAFQWPTYPTAQASDRLVNKGIVVVASIGNSGANGVYSAGAPGVGSKVIGVASFDNSHVELVTFTISPDNTAIGYGPASGAPAPPASGSLPMAKTGTPTTANDACLPLAAGSLAGKAVLIRRGGCTFHTKSRNAQNAGAAAVVLYNNVAGRFSPTVAGTPAITIPVVAVSDSEGVLINNRLNAGPVTMTWTDQTGLFLNPTGGLISSFSSYGLAADLSVKPDLGAPGGAIRSTFPVEKGSYATLSGTSTSSPHVAGSIALLEQARPNTPAQAVRSVLQNSADPRPWWGNPALGLLDNVHRQGAGMLDIDDAILSTTKVEPGKLSLGESEAGPATRTLAIQNNGPSAVTYNLSHAPALSTRGSTFAPIFTTGFASAAFSSVGVPVSSVTVPAGGTATVDVTVTANPALADRAQYGGYIVLTPQGGGQAYRVPYAGFKGNYQSIQVLAATPCGLPALAKSGGSTACGAGVTLAGFTKQPTGGSYTLAGGDIPYVLVHLDHQARRLRAEIRDAGTGTSWHRPFEEQYMPRNSTSTGFFAFPVDGTTKAGNKSYTVPDGQYVIVLSVQKALGNDGNPAHWETWTSPAFTIDRP